MQRFGNTQVNRYLEKQKMAVENEFTPSIDTDAEGSAQGNGGQAAN